MGKAYTYRCDKCSFEARFNEGHGFLIHPQPLDSYLKSGEILFHHKTHKALLKFGGKGKGFFLDAGFKIYKCPQCGLLYDKVDVTVYYDGKPVHKSEFRCSRCRSRL